MTSKPATRAKNVGGLWVPPTIKEAPVVKDGIATVTLTTLLREEEKVSFHRAFDNCCRQKRLNLRMQIRGFIVTITGAAKEALMIALKWLQILEPPPQKVVATPQKPKIATKPGKPPKQRRVSRVPHGGIRFA